MTRREEPIPALSAGLSHLMLTGVLLLVALPPLSSLRQVSPGASPQPPRIEETLRAPAPAAPPSTQPPVSAVVTPGKEEWPLEDIMRGREQCMHLLASSPAEIEWLEPIKKGECGLPAPVRLKSIGSNPKVVFDPPVDVNCRMVAALAKWAKSTLQPKAKERLKSTVVRIVGASGYSCRNIYNLPNARLSQHALANAIDIGGFSLANGRTVGVLKGWGLTARDIKAQAKKDAKAKGSASKVSAQEVGAASAALPGRPENKSGRPVTQASMTPPRQISSALQNKSVLGGLPAAKGADPAKSNSSDAQFLRAIHGGACGDFGTVLGPEANDPHRNHFHLDLISRQGRGYCE